MKYKIDNLDITYYKEELDNGLCIYLLPFKDKKDYFINYFTRYGSCINEFIPEGKKDFIKVPDGIAHFLEHKLFEMEDGEDVFNFYSKSGTDTNACTSFNYTKYICYGNKNFNENLKFLINFVNKPYFTDKNVKKEKGIIIEELKMYDDMPDYKLDFCLRECLFKDSNYRLDVGGTIESVSSITKEDLYLCYNNFYIPNNMHIVITGNFDLDETIEIIKEETKNLKKRELPKIKNINEMDKVYKEFELLKYNDINIPKMGLGLKMNLNNFKIDDFELNFYLNILFNMKFGSSSLFKEKMRDNNICNNFYFYLDTCGNHKILFFEGVANNYDELVNSIKLELKDNDLKEEDFNRMKKLYIAREIKIYDDVYGSAYSIVKDLVDYNKFYDNKIDIIKNLEFNKLLEIFNYIDFNNISIVKMERK